MRQNTKLGIILAAAVVPLSAGLVHAATWTGTVNTNWNNSGNWTTPATVPNGNDAVATGASTSKTTVLDTNVTLGTLTTGASGTVTWTINGSGSNAFTLNAPSSSAAAISTAGVTQSLTVAPNMVLGDDLVISNTAGNTSGAILLNGSITDSASQAVTITSHNAASSTGKILVGTLDYTGTLTLNGGSAATTAAAASNHLVIDNITNKVTTITVARTLTGAGTFYGDVRINGGTLSAPVTADANQTVRKATSANTLIVNADNSSTFNGLWVAGDGSGTADTGVLQFNSLSATGSAGARIVVNKGTVAAGYAIDQSFIDRVATSAVNGVSTANGIVALAADSANNLALGALPTSIFLGAVGTRTFSGTVTTSGTDLNLGGGGGTLIISTANALDSAKNLNVGNTNHVDAVENVSVLEISASQNYTGKTTIQAGTLRISSMANGGSDSPIGKAAATADKLIFSALAGQTAALEYVGMGNSTDRLFSFSNNRFSATILSSGSGALNFTSSGSIIGTGTNTTATAKTLTLGGTNADSNTLGPKLQDIAATPSGTHVVSLVKSGSGKWLLTNANTYSGGTAVNAGTLLVNNSSGSGTGTGAVAVADNAVLGGTGAIAPTGANGVSVVSGGTIAPGASIGNLTIDLSGTSGGVTMASGSGFVYELGAAIGSTFAAPGSSDRILVSGASIADVAFNSNSIDFLGGGEAGVYKLFDSDLATSVEADDTWSGLSLGGVSGREILTGLSIANLDDGLTGKLYVGDGSTIGDAGDIYLEIVPEPGSMALLALAGGFALRRRRR